VAILDVDDIWEPEKLTIQSNFLNIYDVIGTKCLYFGDKNFVLDIPVNDITNFDFTKTNPIINSSSVIRKELCFWNNNWDSVEDYELWLRLRKMGKKFYNCEEVLVKHRIHNTSAFNSKGNENLAQNLLKLYK
jgi:GT2 family glycosyltransferase